MSTVKTVRKAPGADVWKRMHRFLDGLEGGPGAVGVADGESLREKWRRRAAELAKPTVGADEGVLLEKVIIVKAGKDRYAFRVADVEEIMRVPVITPVPCVPDSYAGVVNRRGSILPLVDLKVFFGGSCGTLGRDSRVLVLSRGRSTLGLLVEAADKILGLPPEAVKPPLRRGEGVQEEFCVGVITLDKKVIVLVDSKRLMQDDRLKIDTGA